MMFTIYCNSHSIGTDDKHGVERYFYDMLGRLLTNREWFLLKRQGLSLGGDHYNIEAVTADEVSLCESF